MADEKYLALIERPDVLGHIDEDAVETLGTVSEVQEKFINHLHDLLGDYELAKATAWGLMRALGVEGD